MADLLAVDAPAGVRARGRGAKAGTAEVRLLDLASLASVRAFAAEFLATGGKGGGGNAGPSTPPPLHVLVNNAGIFTMVGQRSETEDGLESHMGTNHLGPFLLTLLLLPALARAGTPARPARAVHVSSAMHRTACASALATDPQQRLAYSPTVAYSQSKLAQVVFAAELRRRLSGWKGGAGRPQAQKQADAALASPPGSPGPGSPTAAGGGGGRRRRRGGAGRRRGGGGGGGQPSPPSIVVTAVHPGEVLTDVVRSLPPTAQAAYRALMSAVLLTPSEGARSSVWAATAVEGMDGSSSSAPTTRGLVGPPGADPALCYFGSTCRPETPLPAALDPAVGRWLWAWSVEKVGLGEGQDLKVGAWAK